MTRRKQVGTWVVRVTEIETADGKVLLSQSKVVRRVIFPRMSGDYVIDNFRRYPVTVNKLGKQSYTVKCMPRREKMTPAELFGQVKWIGG